MRWTLPNILTLARICLTPVIALLPFIQGYWPKVIAFLIFLAAGASDIVDGYLARRRNEVSELGQLLDPIADKLLLFATLIPIFCLTPVIALLPFIQGYWPKVIAFLIFLAASASDVVDGYLARRRNEVSELGQLLDPIADKLLLFATLIPIFWLTRHPTILVDYRIPWWGSLPVWVALLLVGRELLITAFRFFAKRRGVVIPAIGAGKLKAVVQNVFIGATLFWFAWKDALAAHPWAGWFRNFWDQFHGAVVAVTIAGAILLTVYSLVVYLYRYRQLLK